MKDFSKQMASYYMSEVIALIPGWFNSLGGLLEAMYLNVNEKGREFQ